jgi:hypothetical protein
LIIMEHRSATVSPDTPFVVNGFTHSSFALLTVLLLLLLLGASKAAQHMRIPAHGTLCLTAAAAAQNW